MANTTRHSTLTLRIDPELKMLFKQACYVQELSAAQVLRGYMRQMVREYQKLLRELQQSLPQQQAAKPQPPHHEEEDDPRYDEDEPEYLDDAYVPDPQGRW